MKLRRGIQWVKAIEEQPNTEKGISQRVSEGLPEMALSVFFALLFMITTKQTIVDVYEVEKPDSLVLFCIFWAMFGLARLFHRNGLMVLPPVVVIAMGLWDGKVPGKVTWFLLLAGILLCSGRHWERADMQVNSLQRNREGENKQSLVWLLRGLVVSMLCGLLLLTGTGWAQKVVEQHAKGVVALVADATGKVSGWEIWEKFDLPVSWNAMMTHMLRDETLDYEKLHNEMLQYKYVEVLQVEISEKPTENIYLRGFCGDIYVDGVWQRDWERLEETCKDAEREYDAVRAQIAFSTVRKLQEQINTGEMAQNPNLRQIRVHYTGLVSEQVYVPYFAMVTTKGIGLIGESGFTKEQKVTEVCFDQWKVSQEALPEITSKKTDWDVWYESYVKEHYLQVPEYLTCVKTLAAQIEVEEADSENHIRLIKAQAVAQWLAENTTYSLNPPALTEGTDPIAYFLETSKTGYCMHYAGSAVMLLRQMGVPARYASGYMVEADAFRETEAGEMSGELNEEIHTTGLVASVLDDRAHAWVEIYLDTIGWVPVEVTKGYPAVEATNDLAWKLQVAEGTGNAAGSTSEGKDVQAGVGNETTGVIVQTGENLTEDTTGEDQLTESEEPTGDETEPPDDVETEEDSNASEEDVDSVEDNEAEAEVETTEEGIEGKQEEEEKKIVMVTPPPVTEELLADTKETTRKIIIGIACVLVVIGIMVALVADTHKFFGRESTYYRQLRKEMKRGNHKRVIMMINSGVYRKLHFKQLLAADKGDEAYAKALKDNYKELSAEEWDRYMAIVKAVAFSEKDFTEEDVKFCFDVYRDVIYKDEVW